MNGLQKFFLSLKLSAFVAAGVFAFWMLVRKGSGEVPVMDKIVITDFFAVGLPFFVSRLWDMAAGLFFITPLIFVLLSREIKNEDISTKIISILFLLGLAIGSIYGSFSLLDFGIVTALVILALFNLLAGLVFGLRFGLAAFLGSGLGVSLTVGIATGLFIVLVLVFASLCGSGIFALIKKIKKERKVWGR